VNNTNIRLNNVNPNGENVVANNLNHANLFFLRNDKIDFKNNHHMLFFLRDVIIAPKTKLLILFTLLMDIELIIIFLIDMDTFYGIKIQTFIFDIFSELHELPNFF
jgi:hypothetical protein